MLFAAIAESRRKCFPRVLPQNVARAGPVFARRARRRLDRGGLAQGATNSSGFSRSGELGGRYGALSSAPSFVESRRTSDRRCCGACAYVRLGGTYNHIEIENAAGDIVTDSGHGFGWEAGTGVAFRLGACWHLTPGIRVRSLNRDFSLGGVQTAGTLRYVTAEAGFSRSF
jgi:hypothetical protein